MITIGALHVEFSVKIHIWRGLYKLTYIALSLIEN